MSFNLIRQIPSPQEIKQRYPLPKHFFELKKEFDKNVSDIFMGKSDKFLVIVGPCSADNEDAVLEYVTRLKKVSDKVSEKLFILPRVYTNKPRTKGVGYKGMLHQPDPEKPSDLLSGLLAIRNLHLKVVENTEFMTADEMLYPENALYLDDLLSYIAVGARSVENQQHRLTSSGLSVPVGMKNPTSGDFNIMINSIFAATSPQEFIYRDYEVSTTGNPLSHSILRGSVNKHGQNIPNYHYEDLMRLYDMYSHIDLPCKTVIVDANHSNSAKYYKEQNRIIFEVLQNRQNSPKIKDMVKGVMIESYLVEGAQAIGNGVFGQSITDACLGFEDTEKLLLEMAEKL